MSSPTTTKTPHQDIQWETSKGVWSPWYHQYSVELCFGLVLVSSSIAEYVWGYGVSIFLIASFISIIFQFSAKKHDNIPMFSNFYPIIGHIPWVSSNYVTFYKGIWKEFLDSGKYTADNKPLPIMSLSIPSRVNVFLVDPALVDIVFRHKFGDAEKDEDTFETLREILGYGIFASNGKVWKKHRAIASRMFTTRSLRDYMFKNFMETTDNLLLKCDELMNVNGNNGIDMFDMFLRLTFEAFTNTAFGVNVNAIKMAPKIVPFARAFDETLQYCAERFWGIQFVWKFKKYFKIGTENIIYKHSQLMEAFVENVISKRREYFENIKNDSNGINNDSSENGDNRKELRQRYDLLSLFIKDNSKINDKELKDITMNFIIAGRDTTAQCLSWFMYEMTRTDSNGEKVNGEIEMKIRKEIDTILSKYAHTGMGSTGLSYQAIGEMNYLEASLLETLRIHPSVPHLTRTAVTDINFGEITGDYEKYNYTIRKGEEILVSAWTMGRLDTVWENALTFKPERFLDSKTNKIIEYDGSKYPAFNIVPRMCLGRNLALLEAKICIAKLFTKYKNITIVPNQDICCLIAATNHMKNGLKLVLKRN